MSESESESDTHQQPVMQNEATESESSDHDLMESISHHNRYLTREETTSSKDDLHDSDGSISSTSEVNAADSSDVPYSEHLSLENTVEKAHTGDSVPNDKKPEIEIDSHGSSISCQISLPTECNTKTVDSSDDESNGPSLTPDKH